MLAFTLALFLCTSVPTPSTRAIQQAPPVLQPKTYVSRSQDFEFAVDPSTRFGAGLSRASLTCEGKLVWAQKLPFTFWDAAVADDGTVAGYAYSHGSAGRGSWGDLILAIVDPRGQVLQEKRFPRKVVYVHGSPEPVGGAVLVDETSDRAVFQVRALPGEPNAFLCFRLSTGEALEPLTPKISRPEGAWQTLAGMTPVAGTELLLFFHRYSAHGGYSAEGPLSTRYSLFDENGLLVWDLFLKEDLKALSSLGRRHFDPILPSSEEAQFALWFVEKSERVNFAVMKSTQGEWQVSEISRSSHPNPFPTGRVDSPTSPSLEPELLETLRLGESSSKTSAIKSPIRDVLAFGFSEAGLLRVVCKAGERSDRFRLLLVSPEDSAVLSETEVAIPLQGRSWHQWHCFPGDRWLVTIGKMAWWVESGLREAKPYSDYPADGTENLAVARSGGFAVLAERSSNHGVLRIGRESGTMWTISEGGDHEDPASLFSPEALTVTTADEVVVLDNIRNSLTYYSGVNGSYQRHVDIVEVLGRQPNYLSDVREDSAGGVILIDFEGTPPVVRLDSSGEVRSSFRPQLADGTATEKLYRNIRCAPDGRVWTTDGHAIYRLGEDGVADLKLGQGLDNQRLQRPGAIAFGAGGLVAIQDEETYSVHFFDEAGAQMSLLRLGPSEISLMDESEHLALRHDGRIAISRGEWDENSYLLFNKEGKSLGQLALDGDLTYHPGRNSGWLAGYRDVHLLSDSGAIVRTISRRSDKRWLRTIGDMAMALDGSLAVLDRASPGLGMHADTPPSIATYDLIGKPLEVFELPLEALSEASLACSGRWVILKMRVPALWILDRRDGSTRHMSLKGLLEGRSSYEVGFGQDETELRIIERTVPPRLHRLKMPSMN